MIFLMEITDEGPSRLEGKSWYGTKEAARKAAVQFLRTRRQNARVTLFTAGPTFWVNPNPEILSDETDAGED